MEFASGAEAPWGLLTYVAAEAATHKAFRKKLSVDSPCFYNADGVGRRIRRGDATAGRGEPRPYNGLQLSLTKTPAGRGRYRGIDEAKDIFGCGGLRGVFCWGGDLDFCGGVSAACGGDSGRGAAERCG